MEEAPHPTLLNRDIPPVLAKQHFGDQLSLMRDVVNYGSNLIARAYTVNGAHLPPKFAVDVLTIVRNIGFGFACWAYL